MTVLTPDEIREYCAPLSIGMEDDYVRRLYFERCPGCRVHVGQFDDAASAAFDTAASLLAPGPEGFGGAMIWLTGSHPTFGGCEAAFARVRKGLGTEAPIDERPGHRFGPDEFDDAAILMGFVMTFGWDAIWVPAHGEYLMAVNHDNFIDFAVRNGGERWDAGRQALLDNLGFRPWPQMKDRYCPQ